MKKVLFQNIIEKQLNTWKERVFFPNEKFKENTAADLTKLREYILESQESFVIISAETESSTYKIGRFMVENGVNNNSIAFQDGAIFDSYIDPQARYDWQGRQLCDQLFENIGCSFRGKWLIVPDMNNPWNKKLAIYFITKLKQSGCYGLLFYSDTNVPDSLSQVLCEETYEKLLQFPRENYKLKKVKRDLKSDDY